MNTALKVAMADEAHRLAKEATAAKQTSCRILKELGHPLINRVKAHPDYNKALGVKLGIEGSVTSHNLNDAVPDLTAIDKTGGTVELRFSRRGSDGVNIYYQRGQDSGWNLVGRVMTSPFLDVRALQTPNQLEIRRYTAVYTQKTQEVGRFSEDVMVTCIA